MPTEETCRGRTTIFGLFIFNRDSRFMEALVMFVPELYFRDAFVVVNGSVAYKPDLRDTRDLVGVGVHDSFSHLVCFVDEILCFGVEGLGMN